MKCGRSKCRTYSHNSTYVVLNHSHSKSLVYFVNQKRFSFLVTTLGVYMPKYGQLYMSPAAKVINRCSSPHNLVAVKFPLRPAKETNMFTLTFISPFHRANYLSIYLMSHVRCAHIVHANVMINHQHSHAYTHTILASERSE